VRWYIDSEFIEDGRTIDLISFGMVSEDGARGYWINGDDAVIDRAVYHDWLRPNVVRHLPIKVRRGGDNNPDAGMSERKRIIGWDWDLGHPEIRNVMPKRMIAQWVQAMLSRNGPPELWAWYSAYDHVVLAQLFGRMIDLPAGIPMLTCDLKQECLRVGDPKVPEHTGRVHHALDDAIHDMEIHDFLLAFTDQI
jgi:3' exoribonuclease, RNase T-like